jgi:hypothetical protein
MFFSIKSLKNCLCLVGANLEPELEHQVGEQTFLYQRKLIEDFSKDFHDEQVCFFYKKPKKLLIFVMRANLDSELEH